MGADRPAPPVTDPSQIPLVPLDRDDEAMVRSWATTTATTFLGGRRATATSRGGATAPGSTGSRWASTTTRWSPPSARSTRPCRCPGGALVDVNAVSGVTVLATHRRRGLLSRWMTEEMARAARRRSRRQRADRVRGADLRPVRVRRRVARGAAGRSTPAAVRWRPHAPLAPGTPARGHRRAVGRGGPAPARRGGAPPRRLDRPRPHGVPVARAARPGRVGHRQQAPVRAAPLPRRRGGRRPGVLGRGRLGRRHHLGVRPAGRRRRRRHDPGALRVRGRLRPDRQAARPAAGLAAPVVARGRPGGAERSRCSTVRTCGCTTSPPR